MSEARFYQEHEFTERADTTVATLRDQLAMAALTGLLGRRDAEADAGLQARVSYLYADAMLKARSQEGKA